MMILLFSARGAQLTHRRRHAFEVAWPDEAVRSLTCVGKDAIVSVSATLMSIVGAMSTIMMEVPAASNAYFGATDARVHARYIMALASFTNCISAVLMGPIYVAIATQKVMSCTLNDVSATLENFAVNARNVAGGGGRSYSKQLGLTISFGSARVESAVAESGVATCLTEDITQSVKDAVASVAPASGSGSFNPRLPARVATLISSFLDDVADTVTRTFVSWAFHGLDVFFAWLLGIVRGIQDVAQTLDWDNCKLPVVDTGLRSYGRCACGDAAQSIPAAAKQQTWEHGAFWCSGFLMLNEADGADLLVWNPFSLDELLRSPGADGGNADAYLACLRSAPAMGGRAACAGKRPVRDALEQQGVEVMQVVARCRANYQQARWDEASTLYALFGRDVWARVGLGGRVAGEDLGEASWARDRWTGVRRAMAHAMDRAGSGESALLMTGLSLSVETWACLDDALRGGDLAHSCWRLAARAPNREFAYGEAPRAEKAGSFAEEGKFADVDACRAFSGAEWADAKSALAGGLPRTMWSGSSSTREPVARLHPVVEDLAAAQAEAAKELRAYVDAHIAPAFERLGGSKLRDALEQQLSVQTWSVEGDSLHQLVDCVFLGPYAAAELAPNLHDGGARLPAPLYHRGRADSRAFASSGDTGGSAARRAFVQEARAELAQHGASVVASEAWRHFDSLRARWLGGSGDGEQEADIARGLLCACEKPGQFWERIPRGMQEGLWPVAARLRDSLLSAWAAGPAPAFGAAQVAAMEHAAGERFEFASYVEAHGHLFKPASFRASIKCCVEQAQAGLGRAELVFTADAPFERREWDIGDTVLAGALSRVANSSVWARMLHGEGWRSDAGPAGVADAYRPPARLRTEERSRLQEAQLFAPAHRVPVRAYDETEEALGGEPLWQACNARVAGLYATLPWTRAADDADTTLGEIREARDAAELLGAVLEQRVPGAGIHALEGAVAKLLTRAHALSAGFYTHAHRYVPSDSVWCEKDAAARGAPSPPPRARAAHAAAGSDAPLPGLDPAELARIRGPGAGELLYPAAALDHCACGWQGAGGASSAGGADGADLCYVPAEACASGAAALAARDAARDAAAPNATDARAWAELCAPGTARYGSRASLLLVLRVLRLDAERDGRRAPAWAALCDAAVPSTSWGLLDADDEAAWYAGDDRAWRFDARRLASAGPGGLRLGLLAAAAVQNLSGFAAQFNLGGDLRHNFVVPDAGAEFAHTVAQPVCRAHLADYLAQPLEAYFADVLLPMAHSVQLGSGAACGRWAVEVALGSALARGFAAGEGLEARGVQAEVASVWERRCVASVHAAGICALRGVFAAGAAPASAQGGAGCAFAGPAHAVHGCARHFYTPGCLLNCDGQFYDPCLCEAQDASAPAAGPSGAPGAGCAARAFEPGTCARGRVGDARGLALGASLDDPAGAPFMLSSMLWPSEIDPGESRDAADLESLRAHLGRARSQQLREGSSSPGTHGAAALYNRSRAWLLADAALDALDDDVDDARVHAHCDDLHDYWPDAQHPVGYHPTTACRRADTAVRGFAAWMSRDGEGRTLVDPMRFRNATRASEVDLDALLMLLC